MTDDALDSSSVRCHWPRWPSVLAYLMARGLVALAAAWPMAAVVGVMLWAEPDGDRVLWGQGAEMLVDVVDRLQPSLAPLAGRAGLVVLLGSFLMLFPLAMLLASMTAPDPGLGAPRQGALEPLLRAAGDSGALALLQGTVLLLQVASSALVVFVGALVARSLELGRQGQWVSQLTAIAVAGALVWWVGVWHDVARVAVVQHGQRLGDAVATSLMVAGAGLGRPLGAAAWRAGLVAVLLVGALWGGLRLEGAVGGGPWAPLGLHLGAFVGAVLLRISWLRWVGLHVGGLVLRPAAGISDGAS